MLRFIRTRIWWEALFLAYLPGNLRRGYTWGELRLMQAVSRQLEDGE